MIIKDINGAEKNAKSLKKIKHAMKDVKTGEVAEERDYVEAEITGKNNGRTWKEWYPLEEFKKLNPGIKI